MSEEQPHELIIVKRYEEEEHAAHSSAWKVAHADFMTAMMAFFLIMWLINVTDDEVRKGISQYFNPIHLSQGSTDLKGLNAPDANNTDKSGKKGPNDPAPPALNPVQLTAAGGSAQVAVTPAAADTKGILPPAGGGTPSGAAAAGQSGAQVPTTAAQGAAPGGGQGADALGTGGAGATTYQDPYAALSKLPADPTKVGPTTTDIVPGDSGSPGAAGGELSRDPFDPIYWQLTQLPQAKAANPGPADSIAAVPNGAKPDAAAPSSADANTAGQTTTAGSSNAATPAASQSTPAQPPAPSDVAVITPDAGASGAAINAANTIATQIAASVQAIMAGSAPDLSVRATAEGTLIGLMDDAAYSMFPVGSATPDAKVVALMGKIADALAMEPGDVIIRGYTDARPFHTADNDNWRLSAARAHAAYDLLVRAGLADSRVVAIEGYADRNLFNPADPNAAENRRIEILLKVPSS